MTPDSLLPGRALPNTPVSQKRLVRGLKTSFLLAVVVFWGLFIHGHWAALASTKWSVDVPWGVASFLAFGLYFVGQGMGWVMISRAMGYALPAVEGTGVWLLSMPARYVPGNLWHIAARITLVARYQVSPAGVVLSSTTEQLLMVLSAACLGLAWLPSWVGGAEAPWALVVILACLAALQPSVIRHLLRLGSRLLGRTLPDIKLGYRDLASLLIWYTVVNALNGLAFVQLATGATQLPESLWPSFASAYCLAYVVGYVSFLTPSGLGVREAALTSMLSLYLPLPTAVTLTLLARIFSTAGEAVAVLAVGLPAARGTRKAPSGTTTNAPGSSPD